MSDLPSYPEPIAPIDLEKMTKAELVEHVRRAKRLFTFMIEFQKVSEERPAGAYVAGQITAYERAIEFLENGPDNYDKEGALKK